MFFNTTHNNKDYSPLTLYRNISHMSLLTGPCLSYPSLAASPHCVAASVGLTCLLAPSLALSVVCLGCKPSGSVSQYAVSSRRSAARAALSAAAASDWSPVVHLLVSLPAVMRVQVALSEAAQPAGPLLSVRVLGWDEQLLPLPFSSHSSHTGSHLPSLASSSSTPPSSSSSSLGQPSHTSLSSRHVLQLVQAQLTAHLHRCNSLLSSSAAVASLSHCPLFHFLLHLASYHSLFESACVGCGAVLAYHSDSAKLLPAVVRSVGGASSLHAACLAASTADVPNQSSHTTPTHTPPPAGNSKGAGSGSGSSATVQARHRRMSERMRVCVAAPIHIDRLVTVL